MLDLSLNFLHYRECSEQTKRHLSEHSIQVELLSRNDAAGGP